MRMTGRLAPSTGTAAKGVPHGLKKVVVSYQLSVASFPCVFPPLGLQTDNRKLKTDQS
jgi:hypothetical protein